MKKLASFIFTLTFLFLLAVPSHSADHGNTTNQSFNKAQKMLERKVYYDHRTTFYCGCPFSTDKKSFPVATTRRKEIINEPIGLNGSTSFPPMPLVRVSLNGEMATLNASLEKENPLKDGIAQGKWPFRSDTWRQTCIIWCRP